MKRTLESLRNERNLHLVIFVLLLLPIISIYGLVFALYIYPVAGLVQLATVVYIVVKYKDTKRLNYLYAALACLVGITGLVGWMILGGNTAWLTQSFLLPAVFLFIPLALSFWLYWISRNEYNAAQQA